MSDSRVFKPLKIGNIEVKHRIGMPGLSRTRADADNVPTSLMKEYYGQRASAPGTLIITESSAVALRHSGYPCQPGLWKKEQVAAWKEVIDEVHSKGSFIFAQLAAMGRAAGPEVAKARGFDIISADNIAFPDGPQPRAITIPEIKQTIQDFVTAAKNAIAAGFDGVEFHSALGYIIDSFTQDVSNHRTDEYGGSIENRSRFINELMTEVAAAIGPKRLGIRLSPWSTFQGMRMEDPVPQFTDVINKAKKLGLAYIHLIESRVIGGGDGGGTDSLDFAIRLWDGPVLVAGGYTPELLRKAIDHDYPDRDIIIMFGRHFSANPDLVFRIKEGLELNKYKREFFYTQGAEGYTDFPFSEKNPISQKTPTSETQTQRTKMVDGKALVAVEA